MPVSLLVNLYVFATEQYNNMSQEFEALDRELIRAKRDLDKLKHLAAGLSQALLDAGLRDKYDKVLATCEATKYKKEEVQEYLCCANCLAGNFCSQVQVQQLA